MSTALPDSANLGLALSAYFLATASPGPSNLAIMATALRSGARAALMVAAGVVSGSCVWGIVAALGLSSVLGTYAQALVLMKLLGGLYLLVLAFRSARLACCDTELEQPPQAANHDKLHTFYLRGLGLHLTNPKAILSWLAIVALALPLGAGAGAALHIVASCSLLGVLVFGAYALLFSSAPARRAHQALHRPLQALLALVFGLAGFRLLRTIPT